MVELFKANQAVMDGHGEGKELAGGREGRGVGGGEGGERGLRGIRKLELMEKLMRTRSSGAGGEKQ